MNKINLFLSLLLIVMFSLNTTAQNAGDNDPTFNPIDVSFGDSEGANSYIYTSALQSDGKIIIGGTFSTYNGTARSKISRLNTDGSLDTTFNSGTGANSTVQTTAIQPDGKIIIGGYFTSYNGLATNRIARLNIDGSLDATFNVGTGANSGVFATTIQSDGKIIIGGYFTSYNGDTINRIARLNTDGSLDTSFDPGAGANNGVLTTALQPDGKIIIGGYFTSYNGIARKGIARLNDNASVDTTFNPGTGVNGSTPVIYSTALQFDGKVIIGGDFSSYNGTATNRIARLNSDGNIDTTFNLGTGPDYGIRTIAIQPDGKVIIGGSFNSFNGLVRKSVVRLYANGVLDSAFNPVTGAPASGNPVYTSILQPDGKIIIAGQFYYINNIEKTGIARLYVDGILDGTFNPSKGTRGYVYSTAIQSDGKIIIAGGFTSYNDTIKKCIARLNIDGTLDPTFNSDIGANGSIKTITIQSDGKIIIGGNFTSYNGTARNRIARLNTDGTLDTSFNPGTGVNGSTPNIYSTALQSDGKIIIGGVFDSYNGTTKYSFARLNTDGSLDASFNAGTGVGGTGKYINTITIQPDGKIIIGGSFASYNGTASKCIARINPDGTIDGTFNVGTGVNYSLHTTAIQPDGKIIIGGNLDSLNGIAINSIARLHADGSIDTTFNSGTGTGGINKYIYTTTLQTDGKIIIGGEFISYNGVARNYLARLNTNGTLDTTFSTGIGPSSFIRTTALQLNGKVIIGGEFTSYNGIFIKGVARILQYSTSMGSDVIIACDSLVWIDGNTYTTSTNIPTYTLTSINGGDSIVTLNLTINNQTFGIDVVAACDSITWIDGNTYTASTNTPTFTLTNSVGCDSVVTLNFTINNVNANYNAIDNGNGNFSFTNTSTGNFNQTHWAFGDGTTSTAANPNHTFNANGTYVVVLTVNDSTNASCMDYYLDTIVVTGVVAPLQCAAGFSMYPDAGNVVLVNSSTGSNLTYLWDFGDGNTSNAQFPTHTYATSGNFYLCLTIDDGAGCVDMYCDSIGENGVVFNKQTGFTINVIAPPLATQVNEQAALTSGMNIYPNPTGNLLNVVLNEKEHYQLTIVTIDGKWLESKPIIGNTTVDVSKYASGMYFITATNNEGKVYQSKFVKE